MKIFSWMQSKLIARNGSKKQPSSVSANNRNMLEEPPHVEEPREMPDDLLSIGTIGNIELNKDPENVDYPIGESSSSSPQNFTAEEEGDIFHSCESSLRQVLDPTAVSLVKGSDDDDDDPDYSKKVQSGSFSIWDKSPDICLESNKRNTLGKRSMAYLLKKVLICSGGFPAMPSLRDPFQTESRMDKIMKAILLKKIHPQASSPLHKKKYLTSKQTTKAVCNKNKSTNWKEDD